MMPGGFQRIPEQSTPPFDVIVVGTLHSTATDEVTGGEVLGVVDPALVVEEVPQFFLADFGNGLSHGLGLVGQSS